MSDPADLPTTTGVRHGLWDAPPSYGQQSEEIAPSTSVFSQSDAVQELSQWWINLANIEVERTVPKAVEYGSNDLIEIGRQLAALAGLKMDETGMAELGVAFYAYGKLSRVMSAFQDGRMPSDDTWFDLGVYVRMAQRIRAVGSWPGTNLSG